MNDNDFFQLKDLIKDRQSKDEIFKFFSNLDLNLTEFDEFYDRASNSLSLSFKKKFIFSLFLLPLFLILMTYGATSVVAIKHQNIYTFFSLIFTFIFLHYSASLYEKYVTFAKKLNYNYAIGLGYILGYTFFSILFMFFILIFIVSFSKDNHLKIYGIKTTGVVTDGANLKLRRNSNTYLTVKFEDENKNTYFVDITVTERRFDKSYQNEVLDIVYSTKDPNIAKLLPE